MKTNRMLGIVGGLSASVMLIAACGGDSNSSDGGSGGGDSPAGDALEISLWTHSAGNPAEEVTIDKMISDFNGSQTDYSVVKTSFPQESYNDSVSGAALADELPCLLDVDGPVMPNWAWAGWMQPIGLDESLVDGFLPGAVGRWQDEVYSVGYWDAAVGMYTRQSYLDTYEIRTPTVADPWTAEEFATAEATIKASGDFDYAIDYGTAWTGEWWPYAFTPFLQSFGGDLIDRDSFTTAEGVLNGPKGLAWGEWWQAQFAEGYAPKAGNADRTEFIDGTIAIQWNGNWAALAAMEAYDDVVFLPPPDFGDGAVIGAASWQWGLSSSCSEDEAAGGRAYLEFTLSDPAYIAEFSDGTGLIPATAEAAELTTSGNYSEGGPLTVFTDMSNDLAVIRPPTPAYQNAALVFEKGAQDIMNGADVQGALDQMVSDIDSDISANDNYGF